MNIFATSEDAEECALNLDDVRVARMTLETAQILSTAVNINTNNNTYTPGLYKVQGKKHPCCQWAGRSRANYLWLVDHGMCLAFLYRFIYGKVHESLKVIEKANELRGCIPLKGQRQEFANCTSYKESNDRTPIIERYQKHLSYKWDTDRKRPEWTDRGPPEFWYTFTK